MSENMVGCECWTTGRGFLEKCTVVEVCGGDGWVGYYVTTPQPGGCKPFYVTAARLHITADAAIAACEKEARDWKLSAKLLRWKIADEKKAARAARVAVKSQVQSQELRP